VQPGHAATSAVGTVTTPIPSSVGSIGVDWTVLVPIIGTAIGLLVTTTFNAVLSYHNGKKSDAIHVLVNSGMTKALADNAAQAEEIRTLRSLVQALNDRISGMPGDQQAQIVTVHPTPAEIAQAQAVVEAGRLPSNEVITAQGSTPGPRPR
jgi:hypothetical protein